jgi:hypothetical protein
MAVEKTLANPTIEVNDAVIGIVPNSCSYKTGKGDINIRAQSAGGNSIDVIKTENAETKISMVKFKLFNTTTNVGLVRTWQDSINGNTIALSDGDFIEAFREMFIITDPEVMLGADGELEVEFNGRPSL